MVCKEIIFALCLFLVVVIDFCLVKCLICDPETNYQSLRMQWSSHASATQRKGTHVRAVNTHKFSKQVVSNMFCARTLRCQLLKDVRNKLRTFYNVFTLFTVHGRSDKSDAVRIQYNKALCDMFLLFYVYLRSF